MSAPVSNWNGRPLRCSKCGYVAAETIEGICPDCHAEARKCDRCGRENTATRPFRLRDWATIGLDGVSRFCFPCAASAPAGYVEVAA